MSRIRILGAIAAGAFLVAACGSSSATNAPSVAPQSQAPASEAPASGGAAACAPSTTAGTVAVKVANFAFDPSTVTAKVGDIVTWTNNDSTAHTATVRSDESCSTDLAAGASGSIQFNQAGTYDFFCKIHSQMTGKIVVS